MVNIRFVEDGDPEQVLDDVEMAAPPAVGDGIRFQFRDHEDQRWTVAHVEHVIPVNPSRPGLGRPTGAICRLKP